MTTTKTLTTKPFIYASIGLALVASTIAAAMGPIAGTTTTAFAQPNGDRGRGGEEQGRIRWKKNISNQLLRLIMHVSLVYGE
jgi:hypothetical protein